MKRNTSGASGDGESIDSGREKRIGAADGDLSEAATSFTDPRATSGNATAGDGSVRYRIAALIAMLLLAGAGLAIWLYLRFS